MTLLVIKLITFDHGHNSIQLLFKKLIKLEKNKEYYYINIKMILY